MLPDRWNPRVWLRDWLNKSTPTERARWEALQSWTDDVLANIHGGGALHAAVEKHFRPKEDGESPPSDPPQTEHPRSPER